MSYNESLNSNSNYPSMSQSEWDSAPWNQSDPDEKEFECFCSQTLSKTVTVYSSNYTEGWEDDYDDEGCRQSHHWVDTDDIDWAETYHENDCHTPQQLIELFGRYLQSMLGEDVQVSKSPSYLKRLIEECEGWEEDDVEYMEG